MRVLFDHNVPYDLKSELAEHDMLTADELGWNRLANGELLKAAQAESFDIFITADQSIFYQQNNKDRRIALIVLSTNNCKTISRQTHLVREAIVSATIASYAVIEFERTKTGRDLNRADLAALRPHQRQKLVPRLQLALEHSEHRGRHR